MSAGGGGPPDGDGSSGEDDDDEEGEEEESDEGSDDESNVMVVLEPQHVRSCLFSLYCCYNKFLLSCKMTTNKFRKIVP